MFLTNCVLMLNWIVWNRTICIKMDLALNNLQRLICHKTQPTNQVLQCITRHQLLVYIVLIIQFNISHLFTLNLNGSNSSICPVDRTLQCATTSGLSGPGSKWNEDVLHITQSFKTRASPSDCFVSCPGYSLEGFYPSTEMQLVYSSPPADWAREVGRDKGVYTFPKDISLKGNWSWNSFISRSLSSTLVIIQRDPPH